MLRQRAVRNYEAGRTGRPNESAPNNRSTKSGIPEAWVYGDFVKE
jgi:hypothetical protein